jgi:serine/threonine protein kinase
VKMADQYEGQYLGRQFGNYRLVKLLGLGGFAEVYLGENIYLGTQSAVKVLATRLADEDVEHFRTEARMIISLEHPHIVRVLDFGMDGRVPYIVMSYAPNGSLRKLHPKGTRLPFQTIVSYVKQVAGALQYAHERRLIHRDIKPENILLKQNHEVLLTDFGLVIIAQSTGSRSVKEMAGTAPYMAPEQFQGKVRPASDQYSLGIVVYEWLSGDRPFNGTFIEVASQHMLAPPPPLSGNVPGVSPTIEEVVFTALAKEPQKRFANVQAFATAFEQACQQAGPDVFVAPPVVSLPEESLQSTYVLPPAKVLQPLASIPPDQLSQPTVVATPPNQPVEATELALPRQQAPRSAEAIARSNQASVLLSQPTRLTPRRRPSKRKVLLLVGMILLLMAGSVGLFSFIEARQAATSNVDAAATAMAQSSATAAAVSTVIAQNAATSTAVVAATATVIAANPDPYPPTSGTLVLYDPLSRPLYWQDQTFSDGGSCHFLNGAYHVHPRQFSGAPCYAAFSHGNFTFEIQMTIVIGDCGGVSGGPANFIVCRDGMYYLYTWLHSQQKGILARNSFSPAIKQGLNQTNLIAIVAMNHAVTVYVNGQQVDSVNNNDIDSHDGSIGVFVNGGSSDSAEVVYNKAKVWAL